MSAAIPSGSVTQAAASAPWGERAYQGTVSFALALLGFFVTFSTAGTALALSVLAALCLVAPKRILATRFWREAYFLLGLALLAYVALRTLAGEGFTLSSLRWVNHYQELLVIPLLWAVFSNTHRPQAFGLGLLAGVAYLAALYWIFGSTYESTFGLQLLQHRISAGFAMAIVAYLLFEHARLGWLPRWMGFGGAAALAATVLLVIDGRTGHVVLLLLLACAAFRAAPRRARLATTVMATVAAIAFAALSPTVRERALETFHDMEATEHDQVVENSSTSIRIEILRNAATVAREHWVLGTGWGHYGSAVADVAHRRHKDPAAVEGALSVNPHNEFLMQLAAGGLPALLLFIAWLGCPVWQALRRRGPGEPWTGTIACVSLAFAVGCLFNSLLLDFTEAHFYAAVVAWLLARRPEA